LNFKILMEVEAPNSADNSSQDNNSQLSSAEQSSTCQAQ
jgi:hypothetical protein